jgi:hypothetical protein
MSRSPQLRARTPPHDPWERALIDERGYSAEYIRGGACTRSWPTPGAWR